MSFPLLQSRLHRLATDCAIMRTHWICRVSLNHSITSAVNSPHLPCWIWAVLARCCSTHHDSTDTLDSFLQARFPSKYSFAANTISFTLLRLNLGLTFVSLRRPIHDSIWMRCLLWFFVSLITLRQYEQAPA